MKLKRIAAVVLITCGVLSLAGCSAKHKYNRGCGPCAVSDADMNGAQVAGLGENGTFGGPGSGGMGSAGDGVHKRVYYFDYDRSDVHQDDRPAICANADYMSAHPNRRAIVEGHTDPRGSREYNVALGERRANSVANLMKSKGVNPDQINVVSYGAERPANPGHSEEDYQLDRRAALAYQK